MFTTKNPRVQMIYKRSVGSQKELPISDQGKYTWATSWENLFMPYANNKGADQPAHPRSLIGAFVVRCMNSIIRLLPIAEISRP